MAAGQTLIVGGKDFIYFGGHLVPCIEPQCGLASPVRSFFWGGEDDFIFRDKVTRQYFRLREMITGC